MAGPAVSAENAAGAAGGSRGGSNNFENLRHQFERRYRAQISQLERAMGEVDIRAFTEDVPAGASGGDPEFLLCGALPPTTSCRGDDTLASARVGRGEKQAARELIARSRAAEAARLAGMVQSARKADPLREDTPDDATSGLHLWRKRTGELDPAPPRPGSELLHSEVEVPPRRDTAAAEEKPELVHVWESRLCKFYGLSNEESALDLSFRAQEKREDEDFAREEFVQRLHFEQQHRQREAEITGRARRRDNQQVFLRYKEDVAERLRQVHAEEFDQRKQVWQQAQDQKAAAAARKRQALQLNEFSLKQGTLDKTCRKVDVHNIQMQAAATRIHRAHVHRQIGCMRSQQLESRRKLCAAEQDTRDQQEKSKLRYLKHMQKTREEQEVEEQRQRIQAQRDIKKLLRTACQDLIQEGPDAATSLDDMGTYQTTLAAFRDLTEDVRNQSRSITQAYLPEESSSMYTLGADWSTDADGLLAKSTELAEPQTDVRGGGGDEEDGGPHGAQADEEPFHDDVNFGSRAVLDRRRPPGHRASAPAPREVAFELAGPPGMRAASISSPRGPGVPVPALPKFPALPPLPAAVAPLPPPHQSSTGPAGAMLPLTARPSASRGQAAPTTPGSGAGPGCGSIFHVREASRNVQSLAALRRVRRTGPVGTPADAALTARYTP